MNGGSETPCSPVMARRHGRADSPRRSCTAKRSESVMRGIRSTRSQLAPHREQLGEERELQRALQERHAARAARAALEPDDALDGLEVAEAPQLEVVLEVYELLARLVRGPVGLRVGVDLGEDRNQLGGERPRLRDIPLENGRRDGVARAREQPKEL